MSIATPVTDITIDGNSLRTWGYNFRTRRGWDNMAAVRGVPVPVAYTDGGYITGSPSLDPVVIGLDMIVLPYDAATGTVTTDYWQHLDDNVQTLKGLFRAGEALDLRRELPNGDVHQLYNARVLDGVGVDPETADSGDPRYRMRVPVWGPEGTWRDITGGVTGETDATNVNLTGTNTVNITVGGNARTAPIIQIAADSTVTGLELTFPDGAKLGYTGSIPTSSVLVFDCLNRVVALDGEYADAGLNPGGAIGGRRARWALLEPGGVNTIDYTVAGGQFDLSVTWYDRWR